MANVALTCWWVLFVSSLALWFGISIGAGRLAYHELEQEAIKNGSQSDWQLTNLAWVVFLLGIGGTCLFVLMDLGLTVLFGHRWPILMWVFNALQLSVCIGLQIDVEIKSKSQIRELAIYRNNTERLRHDHNYRAQAFSSEQMYVDWDTRVEQARQRVTIPDGPPPKRKIQR